MPSAPTPPTPPTPPTYQRTCRLPRLALIGVGSDLPACNDLETAPAWLHPGPVCLPSELPPPATTPECLPTGTNRYQQVPTGGACVPLPSYLRRSHEAPLFRGLGLHRLAVHAASTRRLFSAIKHSQLGTQCVVYALPHSVVTPLCEVPVDNLPGRKVTRQHSPGAATSEQVEYGVGYLSQFVSALSSNVSGWWKQRFKPFPLLVRQVARIWWSSHTHSLHHIHPLCQYC